MEVREGPVRSHPEGAHGRDTSRGGGVAARATDYESYLLIPQLLDLQRPLTAGAHDEMLFVVIHQVHELWFRLIIHEIEAGRDALLKGDPLGSLPPLRRVSVVEDVLHHQLACLETMSPEGFMEFRSPLAPASGFESAQYREIEVISGGPRPSPPVLTALVQAARDRLVSRAGEPSLWTAFCACLAHAGLEMPVTDEGRQQRLDSLASLYRRPATDELRTLHDVAELLVDHDAALARWRFRHALMAEREIGSRTGTGGSSGTDYLMGTVAARLYPDLWAVRGQL